MLRADHDGRDAHRPVPFVPHAHLGFAVGPQPRVRARLPRLRQARRDPVCSQDGQRHQLRRFIRRIPEHQALVACGQIPGPRQTARQRRALLPDGIHHHHLVRPERPTHPLVPYPPHRFPHHRHVVHTPLRIHGIHLAAEHHHPPFAQHLAGHPGLRIHAQVGIEHRISDCIGNFVWMTLRDRLGGKDPGAVRALVWA